MRQASHPEERPAALGNGELFTSPDVDRARDFFRLKSRHMTDKLTTAREAVARLVGDGDYLGVGGFGSNRIPAAVLHEVVRQGRKRLGLAGHTATHDCQILMAGDCVDRCDVAYVVGLEARGLSRNARRAFEEGRVRVTEWTNAALAWRYRAAAMGVPFLPARVMLGTDTARHSAAMEIHCPFTGIRLAALPALFPDVALIHVHRADVHGNCQIDGIMVSDGDLARAARRVIVSAEKIVSNAEIRREPTRTAIPYYCVDAVVEIPHGGYPGNMPYEYFSDEEHLQQWLKAEEDPVAFAAFVRKYVLEPPDFNGYLDLCGGVNRLRELRRLEHFPGKGGNRHDG